MNHKMKKVYGVGPLGLVAWTLVIIAPMLLSLHALKHFPPLHELTILKVSAWGFIPALFAMIIFDKRLFPWATTLELKILSYAGGVVGISMIFAALTLGSVLTINGAFDKSEVKTVSAKVVDTYFFKNTHYIKVHIDSQSELQPLNFSFPVPQEKYEKYRVPTVVLFIKEGYLGIKWVAEKRPQVD